MGFFQILLKEIFSLLNNQSAIWVNITLHSSLLLLKNVFLFPSVWPRKGHSFQKAAFLE